MGVVSDTHGAIRPEMLEALQGVALIIHAGDVDTPAVLDALEAVAPVTAVRGNMDGHPLNLRLSGYPYGRASDCAHGQHCSDGTDASPCGQRTRSVLLPETRVVEVGGVLVYVLHDLSRLDLDPATAQMAAVISGHTHRPRVYRERGVLYLNPGSAGPRRSAPPSVAKLYIEDGRVRATIVVLKLYEQD